MGKHKRGGDWNEAMMLLLLFAVMIVAWALSPDPVPGAGAGARIPPNTVAGSPGVKRTREAEAPPHFAPKHP